MQKDFLTITPNFGRGSQAVTVKASPNTGNARSTTIWGSSMGREPDVHDKQMQPNYFIWKE